jgi:hypothetical protein
MIGSPRLLIALALITGCGEVTVTGLTAPPPGKIALIDNEDRELAVSRGIAFAFECTATEGGYSGPCRDASASSSDDTIAAIFPSYLDTLADAYDNGTAGPRNRTAFVVVGLATGSTTLHVSTSDGDVDVDVDVRE